MSSRSRDTLEGKNLRGSYRTNSCICKEGKKQTLHTFHVKETILGNIPEKCSPPSSPGIHTALRHHQHPQPRLFFFFSSPLLSSVPAGCGAGGDGGAGGERGEGKTGAPASRGGRGRPRSEPAAPAHRPRRRLCSARFLGFLADCFAGGAGLEKQLQWL